MTRPAPTAPPAARTDESFRLAADRDEIAHLVCCRDISWRTAFCGAGDQDVINMAAEVICTMCLEAVEAMSPGWRTTSGTTCPVDGCACPDEHEIDLRIARETDAG
ncbi:hypothetical protein SRB5_65110 [Streptomyces sp. RB5]|uniref:Uncharacterized protein n=1 Tax=Streptomyces smaragdinus TaxID=2585196 RepID=A0A7K0CSH9_9ACTN|nr:hypothetical protein [Streptomyces smaragdinus]MQY16313.1 hypothetical protein [Streptomyces smaragdinus]